MGVAYETIKPGIWLVKMDGSSLVVSIAGPVVAFRLKIMDLPRTGREELYRMLLDLNTTDMVHGAFGLEGRGEGLAVRRHRPRHELRLGRAAHDTAQPRRPPYEPARPSGRGRPGGPRLATRAGPHRRRIEEFRSSDFGDTIRGLGATQTFIHPGRPMTNGAVERVQRTDTSRSAGDRPSRAASCPRSAASPVTSRATCATTTRSAPTPGATPRAAPRGRRSSERGR